MAAVHIGAALVLVTILLARSAYSTANSYVTYVSENGHNTKSCLTGGSQYPCHDLSYVMNHLLCNNSNLEVHAHYSIVISYSHTVVFKTCYIVENVNLTIAGLGHPQLLLDGVGFVYDGKYFGLGVSLSMVGIGFEQGSLSFQFISSLMFFNCTIKIGLYVKSLIRITFDSCYFSSKSSNIYLRELYSPFKLQIMNSIFTSIDSNVTAISFDDLQNKVDLIVELSITNSTFTNGAFQVVELYCVGCSNCSIVVTVDASSFVNNMAIDTSPLVVFRSPLLDIGMGYGDNRYNNLHFNCTNSNFIGNQLGSIIVTSYSGYASVRILNCTFQDNLLNAGNVIAISGVGMLIMDSLLIDNNTLPLTPADCISASMPRFDPIAVMLQDSYLVISNTTFSNNHGTALGLSGIDFITHGNVSFINNAGINGGACAVLGGLNLRILAVPCAMNFVNNTAVLGGAIYVYRCASGFGFIYTSCFYEHMYFRGNYATVSGHSIYFEDPLVLVNISPDMIQNCIPNFDGPHEVTSSPTTIIINGTGNGNSVSVFPGQKISFQATVTDYYNQASSCIADAYLDCGSGFVCNDLGIRLKGANVVLSNGSTYTDLKIEVLTRALPLAFPIPLHIECKNAPIGQTSADLHMRIEHCPLGYVPMNASNSSTCQCHNNSELIYCDPLRESQVVCIQRGYWFGEDPILHSIIAKCQFTLCTAKSRDCPIFTSQNFVQLPLNVDDQCSANHGGLLCTGCRRNYTFTFQAVQCVPSDSVHCANWMPPTVLSLSVVFQFVLAFILVVALRLKLGLGSGQLYGPLFYLAVINCLPFDHYEQLSVLKTIISIFGSVFLLNLELFGEIPWCFFDINLLLNHSIQFLGPLIVAVVLLLTVYLARRFPRLILKLQDSPVQAMCLLMLLSFWSLASTSLRIVMWVYLHSGSVSQTRVALFPEIQYLRDPYHISLWILSILVLLCLICISIMLAITQMLAKKCNLNKIKPFLDEFHSCYKAEYRWYSGVYLLSWVVLQITLSFNSVIFWTFLILLSLTHFLIQPYESQWMNRLDTLLLVDLLFLTSLILFSGSASVDGIVLALVYIFTLTPLSLMAVGGIVIIAIRIKNIRKKTLQPASLRCTVPDYQTIERDRVTRQDAGLPRFDEEREPLLQVLQQEEENS